LSDNNITGTQKPAHGATRVIIAVLTVTLLLLSLNVILSFYGWTFRPLEVDKADFKIIRLGAEDFVLMEFSEPKPIYGAILLNIQRSNDGSKCYIAPEAVLRVNPCDSKTYGISALPAAVVSVKTFRDGITEFVLKQGDKESTLFALEKKKGRASIVTQARR